MARRIDEDIEKDLPPVTVRRKILTPRCLVIMFLILGMLVLAGSLIYTILSNSSVAADPDLKEEWRIVTRGEWLAAPSNHAVMLKGPTEHVLIGHTKTGECGTPAQCALTVRNLQKLHMEHYYNDIGYNFLVGGDGLVYEGCGWGVLSSQVPTFKMRRSSIIISFIGTFTHIPPPEKQLVSAKRLIRLGVNAGHITKNYTLQSLSPQGSGILEEEMSRELSM